MLCYLQPHLECSRKAGPIAAALRRAPGMPPRSRFDVPEMSFLIRYFNSPRAATGASSATALGEADSSGSMPHSAAQAALSSRPMPRDEHDSTRSPTRRRRATPGNEAGQSRIEVLPSEVLHKITGLLPAQAVATTLATSKAMKRAASDSPLAVWNLKHPTPAQPSLADFKRSLESLEKDLSRDLHEMPLTSLGTTINGMPEVERHDAAKEFVKSVDEFAQHLRTMHQRNLADEATPLMELYRAAKEGPRALADREVAVMRKHAMPLVAGGAKLNDVLQQFGICDTENIQHLKRFATETLSKAAMNAGENAQAVARRLGVDATTLEEMTARKASRHRLGGPAYRAVTEKGDKLQDVFTRFGIRDGNIRHRLAQACVNGPAGRDVRAGMSPEAAARQYGLDQFPFMPLQLKRIAEARDAEAYASQSFAGWALRGAGNLVREVAKNVVGSLQEEAHRRAARAFLGNPGSASATAPGIIDGDRLDRMLDHMERDIRRLPRRNNWQDPHEASDD